MQTATTPGGIGAFRARAFGPDLQVPVILFPVTDLLLPGHTKRMHLYEPRWVDMVTTALKDHDGIIGLLYFDVGSEVVRTVTIAEITACDTLGVAGRMVSVRGVARGLLQGLTSEVGNTEAWGFALLREIPELCPTDLQQEQKLSVGDATVRAAKDLDELLRQVDLSLPAPADSSGPEQAPAPAAGSETNEPRLWGHDRPAVGEDFAALGAGGWQACRAKVDRQLAGVPLRTSKGEVLSDAATDAAACLYAALGSASIRKRLGTFSSTDSLAERLEEIADVIRERQGMARARRSLAGIFTEDPSSWTDSGPAGSDDGEGDTENGSGKGVQ